MDRNAFLAIFLSFVLFMLWQFYFAPKVPDQPPKPTGEASSPTTTQPGTAPSLPSQIAVPQAPLKERLAASGQKTWSVSDSLFNMSILASGARVGSFVLDNFRKEVAPDSPPMDLITTQDSGLLPLAVDLIHHQQDWQLSTRPYESPAPEKSKVLPGEPPQTVPFTTEIPGKLRLTKVFTFIADSYAYDVEIQLQNLSDEKLVDQLGISFFFEPYPSKDDYNPSQLTFAQKGSLHVFQVKDMAKLESLPKPPFDWVGFENNYFIQAFVPLTEEGYQILPRVLDESRKVIQVAYVSDTFELGPNEAKQFKLRLYSGPKQTDRLTQAGHNLSDAIDYGWFSIIAKPLLWVLKQFYDLTHNYGVAIILLTIVIKIIFWPLTHKSYVSMQKMKKVQPKIAQIREKYKDDREKLNQELMGVYRTHKVNPMGGCLPMVLQIPVFFALYRMLGAAVDLRHQPFMLWVNDLTAPDRLDIGIHIPYVGQGIPVLTLLMGITMFVQQKMTPTGGDPRQEKIMLMMPVMFTVFFINFPAGLVLYWLVNNVLSIAQQYWINRAQR